MVHLPHNMMRLQRSHHQIQSRPVKYHDEANGESIIKFGIGWLDTIMRLQRHTPFSLGQSWQLQW